LESLLASIPKMPECHYESTARTTFVNVVRALFEFLHQHLEQQRRERNPVPERYAGLYRLLRRFLFGFKAERQLRYLVVETDYAGEELLTSHLLLERFDRDPQGTWYVFLAEAHRKKPKETIQLIEDYAHFQANMEESEDNVTNDAFTNLSKALVAFLESGLPELRVYAPLIPEICTFIVKNELESVEEQKTYLGKILSSQESEQGKRERLTEIVRDVKEDVQQKPGANGARLATIISLISEHYLSVYDLDQSANFWGKVEKKDWLLRLLLSVYRSPLPYVIGSIVIFSLLAALSLLNTHDFVWLASWKSHIPWIALILLIPIYGAGVASILWIGYKLLWRKDFYYSQLLLPRLLGAIVVGLTALLVQDIPWKLAILSDPLNLSIACLIVYSMSFVYVFIEVYNTTKFLRAHQKQKQNIVQYAVRVSRRIFSIGLLEAFLAVLLSSTLFFPAAGLCLSRDFIGGIIFSQGQGLSFGFFPALVVLWTGLALFIGAFVQLIWQERRITASA
jgi:hypothetical protein